MQYAFWTLWGLCAIAVLRYYHRQRHPLLSATITMLCGAGALVACHYFGEAIGFSPPINLFNTMLALVLGVPSLVLLYIVNSI